MLRIIALILMATMLMGAKSCQQKGNTVYINNACETVYELFYADGRFVFTEEEVDHLRPVNQSKISNFKAWFQVSCPEQYKRTLGGKIKKPV